MPAMRLLDLHGIPRSETFKSLLQMLRQHLLEQINSLSFDKYKCITSSPFSSLSLSLSLSLLSLKETHVVHLLIRLQVLLEETFPYISFEEMRIIPFTIMKKHPHIPLPFLLQLAHNPDLYRECPIEVKRQIWHVTDELFRSEVFPLFNRYIELYNFDASAFEWSTHLNTRNNSSSHSLVVTIGTTHRISC
jgi:hypothetical protein